MKKFLKNIFIFIGITLMSLSPLYAQRIIEGGKDLPLELNLIVTYIQQNDSNSFVKMLPTIMAIDTYARSLSREDVFLVGKIEVYKTLLKNSAIAIKTPIDGNSITTLRLALTKTNDNFLKWFLLALIKDSQDLITNPLYKEFLLQKNNNIKNEKVDYRKLEKKGELLQFWISKISPTADNFPDLIAQTLKPKLIEALNNIQKSFQFMASEASMVPFPQVIASQKDLKFFKVSEGTIKSAPRPNQPAESKSVEEILAPITG
ncbi:MAG: hypothetical protein K2Q18_16815, partial [Bdellovibrionales bacterium]|nr:hypothetical protein [Bdellovibrionales bacterium]